MRSTSLPPREYLRACPGDTLRLILANKNNGASLQYHHNDECSHRSSSNSPPLSSSIAARTRSLYTNRFTLPLYCETGGKLNICAQEDRRHQRCAERGKRPQQQQQHQQESFWASAKNRNAPLRPSSSSAAAATSSRPTSARSAAASPPSSVSAASSARSSLVSRVTSTVSALVPDVDEMDLRQLMEKSRDRIGTVMAVRAAKILIHDATESAIFAPPLPPDSQRQQREQRPAILVNTDHMDSQQGMMAKRSTFTLIELGVFALVVARLKRPLRMKAEKMVTSELLLKAQKAARVAQQRNVVGRGASAVSAIALEESTTASRSRSPLSDHNANSNNNNNTTNNHVAFAAVAAAASASSNSASQKANIDKSATMLVSDSTMMMSMTSNRKLHLTLAESGVNNEAITEQEALDQLMWFGGDDIRLSLREQEKHKTLAMTVLVDEVQESSLMARKFKIGTANRTTATRHPLPSAARSVSLVPPAAIAVEKSAVDETAATSRAFPVRPASSPASSRRQQPVATESEGEINNRSQNNNNGDDDCSIDFAPPSAFGSNPAASPINRVASATSTVAAAVIAAAPAVKTCQTARRVPTAPRRLGSAAIGSRPATARSAFSTASSNVKESKAVATTLARPPTVPSAMSLLRATSAQIRRRQIAEQERKMMPAADEMEEKATELQYMAAGVIDEDVDVFVPNDDDDGESDFGDGTGTVPQKPTVAAALPLHQPTLSSARAASLGDVFFLKQQQQPAHSAAALASHSRPPAAHSATSRASLSSSSSSSALSSTFCPDADVESPPRPGTAPTSVTAAARQHVIQIFSPKTAITDELWEQRRQRQRRKEQRRDEESGEDSGHNHRLKTPTALSRQGSGLLRRRSSSMLYRQNDNNLAVKKGLFAPTAQQQQQQRLLSFSSASGTFSASAAAASLPPANSIKSLYAAPNSVFLDERAVVSTIPPLLPVSSSAWHSLQKHKQHQISNIPLRQEKAKQAVAAKKSITVASQRSGNPSKERTDLKQFVKNIRVDRFALDERSAREVSNLIVDRRGRGLQMKREFMMHACDALAPDQCKSSSQALSIILRGSTHYTDDLLRQAALAKELRIRRAWFAETLSVLHRVCAFGARVPRVVLEIVAPAFLPRRLCPISVVVSSSSSSSSFSLFRSSAAVCGRSIATVLQEKREEFAKQNQQQAQMKALQVIVAGVDCIDDEGEGGCDSSSPSSSSSSSVPAASCRPSATDSPQPSSVPDHDNDGTRSGGNNASGTRRKPKTGPQLGYKAADAPVFSEAAALWSEVMRCFVAVNVDDDGDEAASDSNDQTTADAVEHLSWTPQDGRREQQQRQARQQQARREDNALPVLSAQNFRKSLFDLVSERDLLYPDVQTCIRFMARGFNITYAELRAMFEAKYVHFHLAENSNQSIGL